MVILFVGILLQFVYFPQRKVQQTVDHLDKYLIIAQNEGDTDVVPR